MTVGIHAHAWFHGTRRGPMTGGMSVACRLEILCNVRCQLGNQCPVSGWDGVSSGKNGPVSGDGRTSFIGPKKAFFGPGHGPCTLKTGIPVEEGDCILKLLRRVSRPEIQWYYGNALTLDLFYQAMSLCNYTKVVWLWWYTPRYLFLLRMHGFYDTTGFHSILPQVLYHGTILMKH